MSHPATRADRREQVLRRRGWLDRHGEITPRGEACAQAELDRAEIECRLEEESTEFGYDCWMPDESAWSV